MKGTKVQYEESFQRLRDKGLGSFEVTKAKNGVKISKFTKVSHFDIMINPIIADRFPKDVSFSEYKAILAHELPDEDSDVERSVCSSSEIYTFTSTSSLKKNHKFQ